MLTILMNWWGMEVSEAKRLRHLDEENRTLKKLLAETMLEKDVLSDIVQKSARRSRQTPGDSLRDEPAWPESALGLNQRGKPA